MLKVVVTAQDEESCRSLDGRQPKYMWDGMSCEREGQCVETEILVKCGSWRCLSVSQCLGQDGSVRLSLTVTKIETDGCG